LKPDQDVVGTITTREGPLDIIVERISRREPQQPIWLFSRETLEAIPAVYREIDLITLDRYLPESVAKPRIGGIRVIGWVAIVLLVPLSYRLIGLVRLPGPFRLLVLAVAIRWVVTSVDSPLRERQMWTTIAAMFTLIAAVWLLLQLNRRVERYIRTHGRDFHLVEVSSLLRLGHRIADVLVIFAGVLVALRYFGVDPTAALAGLGIGGIAVALAAQKTLENVIGGLSLVFDKAVRVGDFLRLGDVYGTVDSIGLRSTRIRTLDRTMLSVPNGVVANVNVETLSARDMCWFHHTLGVQYDTTSEQMRTVIDGIRERLEAHPDVDRASARVRLFRFGPSSLDIEMFAYVKTADWNQFLEIQEQLLVAAIDVVERAGTAIAFPTQTLHVAEERVSRRAPAGATVSRDADAAILMARRHERPAAGA
jgi:MscS family membrane protein